MTGSVTDLSGLITYLPRGLYSLKPELFNELCLWIIRDWGGIKTGKNEDTLELIKTSLSQKEFQFKRIASSSKIASFMYPDRYAIYDSRVAYTLNWIILSEDAG